MRSLVSILLFGLIIACPLLCQAGEVVDWCLDGCETTCTPSEVPGAPAPCPADGSSCICAGAVQSTDFRSADLTGDLLPAIDGWLLSFVLQPTSLALLHRPGDGIQPDPAPWGAPRRLHVLIQRFLC